MRMQAVIDRFEGKYAVLLFADGDEQVLWPRRLVPAKAKEGDILALDLVIDEQATREARAEAEAALKRLLDQ